MGKRVFIDMDGVLCEYRPKATLEDYGREGYFRELLPREETLAAVKSLIAEGRAEVYILSAVIPGRAGGSVSEKNAWLDEYLPEVPCSRRIFPLCGTNKADAVGSISENDVLIDDYSGNLFGWVACGGKGIKLLNEINGIGGKYNAGPRVRVDTANSLIDALSAG